MPKFGLSKTKHKPKPKITKRLSKKKKRKGNYLTLRVLSKTQFKSELKNVLFKILETEDELIKQ